MDYMRDIYPNRFFGVAVHGGSTDPMVAPNYSLASFPGFSGFPEAVVNRDSLIDPMQLEEEFIEEAAIAPPVIVNVSGTMDAVTRILTIDVTGNFSQNLSGDYRFNAVVTEDSVHGTTSVYDQSNYYNNNSFGPMGGFESKPSHIPAANMYYDFVARNISGLWGGTAGSLPASITSGSTHNKSYTYAVPTDQNPAHMNVIGMVISTASSKVLNVNLSKVTVVTGIPAIDALVSNYLVYPNPFDQSTKLSMELKKETAVNITLNNMLGQTLQTLCNTNLAAGLHAFTIDASELNSGIYFLTITTAAGKISKKIIKQ